MTYIRSNQTAREEASAKVPKRYLKLDTKQPNVKRVSEIPKNYSYSCGALSSSTIQFLIVYIYICVRTHAHIHMHMHMYIQRNPLKKPSI